MHRLEKYGPPGGRFQDWKYYSLGTLGAAVSYGLLFFLIKSVGAYDELYYPGNAVLTGDFSSWSFPAVIDGALIPFPILALSMLGFVIGNYAYFFQESRSIYTMARVRWWWELHRRCWMLPALSAGTMLLCGWVLKYLCYLLFVLATPAGMPLPRIGG